MDEKSLRGATTRSGGILLTFAWVGAVVVVTLLLNGAVLRLAGLRCTALMLDGAVLTLVGLRWTVLLLDRVMFVLPGLGVVCFFRGGIRCSGCSQRVDLLLQIPDDGVEGLRFHLLCP